MYTECREGNLGNQPLPEGSGSKGTEALGQWGTGEGTSPSPLGSHPSQTYPLMGDVGAAREEQRLPLDPSRGQRGEGGPWQSSHTSVVCNTLGSQFLLHPSQVGWVRIPKQLGSPCAAGLVVDVVPSDDIGSPCSHGRADSEGETLVKCLSEQGQHLVALGAVREVGHPCGTRVPNSWVGVFSPLDARREDILDDNGAVLLIAGQQEGGILGNQHPPVLGLVAHQLPVESAAHGAGLFHLQGPCDAALTEGVPALLQRLGILYLPQANGAGGFLLFSVLSETRREWRGQGRRRRG